MKFWFLLILVLLHVLTFLWYFLITKDVKGYKATQVKVLGEANVRRLKGFHAHFTLLWYGTVLVVLSVGFTLYFLQLTSV